MRSPASKTVGSNPASSKAFAADSPLGPAPITATLLFVIFSCRTCLGRHPGKHRSVGQKTFPWRSLSWRVAHGVTDEMPGRVDARNTGRIDNQFSGPTRKRTCCGPSDRETDQFLVCHPGKSMLAPHSVVMADQRNVGPTNERAFLMKAHLRPALIFPKPIKHGILAGLSGEIRQHQQTLTTIGAAVRQLREYH